MEVDWWIGQGFKYVAPDTLIWKDGTVLSFGAMEQRYSHYIGSDLLFGFDRTGVFVFAAVVTAGLAAPAVAGGGAAISTAGTAVDTSVAGAVDGGTAAAGAAGTAVNTAVGGAVDAGAGAVGATGGAVDATVGGAAAGGAAASGAADNAANNSVTAGTGAATAAADNASSSILSSITDTLQSVKDGLSSILSPIADTLHSVSGLVSDINENLIKPIVGPITSILDNYKSLQEGLARDLHSGIRGLLNIPADLTNALTSVDATIQRSIISMGAVNEHLVSGVLAPSILGAGTQAADKVSADIATGLSEYGKSERDHEVKHIHDAPNVENIDRLAEKLVGILAGEYGWLGKIIGALIDVPMMLGAILTYQEPKTALYHQIGLSKWPTTLLGLAESLAAYRRGIMSREDFLAELGRMGINQDRIQVLIDLDRRLPAEADAIDWLARGIIDEGGLADVLKAWGWTEADAARIRQAHKRLPDPASAIAWTHRGLLGEDELSNILTAYDLREADKQRMDEASWLLPDAGNLFLLYDRAAARAMPGVADSLKLGAPTVIIDALKRASIPEDVTTLLWSNHLQLIPPQLACQAWFRGYINRAQLDALLTASAIAPEQQQNYIDLQRPLLPARSVPSYIAAGVLTELEGLDIIRGQGYSDVDANRIINFALHKTKPASQQAASALHGLTVAAIEQLYDAGTLTREQATEFMLEAGMGAEAATLTLTLRDVQSQHALRAAETALIIAKAQSGHLTFDEAQAELGGIGLTTTEVAKATTALERALTAKTKLPSETQIFALLHHGLISRAAAAQVLGLIGFSESWAELLLQLHGAANGTSPANP
jgi:hypothetical protein